MIYHRSVLIFLLGTLLFSPVLSLLTPAPVVLAPASLFTLMAGSDSTGGGGGGIFANLCGKNLVQTSN